MDETVVLPCICKPLLEQKGRRAHQSGGSKGGNQGLALDYCAEILGRISAPDAG
jgi:hypothetical protein